MSGDVITIRGGEIGWVRPGSCSTRINRGESSEVVGVGGTTMLPVDDVVGLPIAYWCSRGTAGAVTVEYGTACVAGNGAGDPADVLPDLKRLQAYFRKGPWALTRQRLLPQRIGPIAKSATMTVLIFHKPVLPLRMNRPASQ